MWANDNKRIRTSMFEDDFGEDRLLASTKSEYDAEENVLRPKTMEEYVGQDKVKEKAILMLQKGKISIDEIQTFFPELSDDEIEEVKGEVMQLA